MARLRLFGRLVRSGRSDLLALALVGRLAPRSWLAAVQHDLARIADVGGRFAEMRGAPLSRWTALFAREGKKVVRGAELSLVAASVELSRRPDFVCAPLAAAAVIGDNANDDGAIRDDVALPLPCDGDGEWRNLMGTVCTRVGSVYTPLWPMGLRFGSSAALKFSPA